MVVVYAILIGLGVIGFIWFAVGYCMVIKFDHTPRYKHLMIDMGPSKFPGLENEWRCILCGYTNFTMAEPYPYDISSHEESVCHCEKSDVKITFWERMNMTVDCRLNKDNVAYAILAVIEALEAKK